MMAPGAIWFIVITVNIAGDHMLQNIRRHLPLSLIFEFVILVFPAVKVTISKPLAVSCLALWLVLEDGAELVRLRLLEVWDLEVHRLLDSCSMPRSIESCWP